MGAGCLGNLHPNGIDPLLRIADRHAPALIRLIKNSGAYLKQFGVGDRSYLLLYDGVQLIADRSRTTHQASFVFNTARSLNARQTPTVLVVNGVQYSTTFWHKDRKFITLANFMGLSINEVSVKKTP